MQENEAKEQRRPATSPIGPLVGSGLVVVGVLLAVVIVAPWLTPQPIEPTPAPTRVATVAAPSVVLSPAASPDTPPTQTSAPTRPTVVLPTAVPATRTPLPLTPTVQPAGTPREGRYLGRDPLPPGIDLSNGPFLKDLKASGYPGVSIGDGGVGDELKAAYLEALKVEQQALNTGNDARLRQHFTGEALASLERRTARIRASTSPTASAYEFRPLVMEFIPRTARPGVYEIVDARTQSLATVERLPDGTHGKVIKAGEAERACYSVQMLKEGGRWKVEFEEAHHDGPEGGKCPPYWS
jgi:hypothetical protein